MSKSNWKGSERRAAKMFPGGKRRLRMGAFSSMVSADDIQFAWCQEKKIGNKIVKIPRKEICNEDCPPIYVDVKKKGSSSLVTEFKEMEGKYCTSKYKGSLFLVTHLKGDNRQFITMDEHLFKQLFWAWFHTVSSYESEE